ncbi:MULTISPECIES: type II secretion system minor pseudopilin [Asaia]|uniref:general secretion pathway protein GspK n=1 Tax=Asaia TaxID=91914 RepID=UPI00255225A2|nr:type II secretion system protein GspK [Asaia sp. HumB]MDL2170594.1 type II secretion system protein GspK [Asaia sp. HumB]
MNTRQPALERPDRGFALVIVLWALAGLSLLTAMTIASAGSALRETRLLRDTARMETLAEGGIASAVFHESGPIATRWPLDGTPHVSRIDGLKLSISLSSQAATINPNAAPLPLLTALFVECGATPDQAAMIAREMVSWRRQAQDPNERQRYLALGLRYLPPHAPFQSLNELALVPGMTPLLLARARPHLSIVQPEELHTPISDPVTRQALARANLPALAAASGDQRHASSFIATVIVSDEHGGASFRQATLLSDNGLSLARIIAEHRESDDAR